MNQEDTAPASGTVPFCVNDTVIGAVMPPVAVLV
jgi:hypothetical protein